MNNNQKDDVLDFKNLEIILHAQDNKDNSDLNCPFNTWMGYDLIHCPGIGEWKCLLKKYYYASDQYGYDSIDYNFCNVDNYKTCKLYQNNGGK
jgi:hypothetical protein